MKRLIDNKKPIHLQLELIAVIDNDIISIPIAAAKHDVSLEYRDLPLEYQLSKQELSTYHNWVKSMASIIVSYGFKIIEEHQSDESYSYYITFTPILNPGVLDNPEMKIPMKPGTDLLLDVKFRLSNHYLADGPISTDSIARSTSSGLMFKEFVVAGAKHSSYNNAIVDLQDICQHLQNGDYSRLLITTNYDI